jgi:hypothetical protein
MRDGLHPNLWQNVCNVNDREVTDVGIARGEVDHIVSNRPVDARGEKQPGIGPRRAICAVDFRFGSRLCENAKASNRDRTNYSFETVLGTHIASEVNFEIELKNIILVALRTFEFSHSLGQKQTHAL